MALLTVTSTGGTNTLTTTTAIPANSNRDYLVVNESEHAITLTLSGATNNNVSWRTENRSNHGTGVDDVNLGLTYVVDAGAWLQLSAYNFHTAAQNVSIEGIAKHITGSSVGDTLFITTYNTARTGSVN